MARRPRQPPEEHLNHEAWAIPYGDLLTLLLAFFVVMYAISTLNEGKYRVVADALSAAFGGPPRSIKPIQVGQVQLRGGDFDHPSVIDTGARRGPAQPTRIEVPMPLTRRDMENVTPEVQKMAEASRSEQLSALGSKIESALSNLIGSGLVQVKRGRNYLEVEIQSDLLFPSGSAQPTQVALTTIHQLGGALRDAPNAVRVEGYTDNQPISNAQFRSNWDLSTARATNVVHALTTAGIGPDRLAAMGYSEYQPIADNSTQAGRNSNRRVEIVILESSQAVNSIMNGVDMRDTKSPQPTAREQP